MKTAETQRITCATCRTVNVVTVGGVPRVECTGCGRILVIRAPSRMETR